MSRDRIASLDGHDQLAFLPRRYMSGRKTLLVVNPRASRVTEATRDLIVHALASVVDLRVAQTEHAGHARSLARESAKDGAELIVALGGDGTVNEVANGILDAGGKAALAVVPSGGADVFARTLGLPNDTIEAADILVRLLESNAPMQARGFGYLADRAFLFNAGVGFDAAVVAAVDKHPGRKRKYGDAYFVMQIVKTLLKYPKKTARVDVEMKLMDGRTTSASGAFVIACLSNPYTFLGSRSFRLCSSADPERGISMIFVERPTMLQGIRIVARGFGKARLAELKRVQIVDGIQQAIVTCDSPKFLQGDGELFGELQSSAFRYEPDLLRVLAPTSLT